jgi:hypothetical protein
MSVDLDIKSYFTPNLTPGFGTIGWWRPWGLAYLNLGFAGDTVPGVHQYVHDQRWEDGLRAPIESIQITKTLDQGSWAHLEMVTHSDRDIFEVVDNEGTGHMLPRMMFPYRSWEIDLKAKADNSWHTPALFRGMLTEVAIQTLSDVAITNQQDGVWRIGLDFQSFDSFNLHKDKGAPLWYHRANATTDDYHWSFTPQDSITFAAMITQIVAWMNIGRPTIDFPITYSFASGSAPYNGSPYTDSIFDPIPMPIIYTDDTGNHADSLTFTNGSATIEGSANSEFTTRLQVGMIIAPDSNIVGADRLVSSNWGKISSITDDNTLVLTAVYGGTTRNAAASSRNGNTIPIITVKDTGTWDILRQVLQHMGVREGLGYTYIPQVSTSGAITVVRGGYDKNHVVDEDFINTQGMQKNTSTDMTIRFNLISVPFFIAGVPANNNNEYWIKFTLYKSDGAGGWTTVKTIPESGYEYVPGPDPTIWRNAVPAHGRKYYKFPTQEITPENTYKWDADLVTGGTFTIGTTGGSAYSPANYNFLNSPTRLKYGDLKTFITTMGKCSQVGIYNATTAIAGCKDGGLNGKCPDRQGCYPDPLATPAEVVNARYGILGSPGDYAYTSNENAWDTLCRQHSQTLYECFQNTDASIREPIEIAIQFNDGWTTDLVGSYLEVYSPEIDQMVMVRCIEQSHALKGKRVSTVMKGFRV